MADEKSVPETTARKTSVGLVDAFSRQGRCPPEV